MENHILILNCSVNIIAKNKFRIHVTTTDGRFFSTISTKFRLYKKISEALKNKNENEACIHLLDAAKIALKDNDIFYDTVDFI